jgi:hypothetical protein
MFRRDPPASAMEAIVGKKKTLGEMKRRKMMRQRKALMKELWFLPWPNVLYL